MEIGFRRYFTETKMKKDTVLVRNIVQAQEAANLPGL